jgi:hypothetical protein
MTAGNLNDPFCHGQAFDPALVSAFTAAKVGSKLVPTLGESIWFLVAHPGWCPEHVEAMKTASVEDQVQFSMYLPAPMRLSEVIKWTLEFNLTDSEVIGQRAREAVERIKGVSSSMLLEFLALAFDSRIRCDRQ